MSWIVNASGFLAAPWMAGRSGPSSTKPRADAALYGKAVSPTRQPSTATSGVTILPRLRRSSIIAWPPARLICLGSLFTSQEPSMPQTPILVPARLRHPPQTGWSWVDRRFVREHAAHLSRDAVLLYFFLCAVADKHGLSFYGDGTLAALLRITLCRPWLQARDELLARDLIAHETRFTQVLSLPPAGQRRSLRARPRA